jgi:hypothetical protein
VGVIGSVAKKVDWPGTSWCGAWVGLVGVIGCMAEKVDFDSTGVPTYLED